VIKTGDPSENGDQSEPLPLDHKSSDRATAPQQKDIPGINVQKAKQPGYNCFVRPLTWFVAWLDSHNGLMTALATATIALLTWSLSEDSRRQADAANDQFKVIQGQLKVMEADQRPWISLEMQMDGPLIHDAIGWQLLIKYNLKNVGKSPADDVDFLAIIIQADPPRPNNNGSPKEWTNPTAVINATLLARTGEGQIMFPNEQLGKWWRANDANTITGEGFVAAFIIGHLEKFALPTAAQIRFKTPRL
jgi:hypothetical protein